MTEGTAQGGQGRRGLRRHCGAPLPAPSAGANDLPLCGAGAGLTATPGAHDRAVPVGKSASTSVPPAPGTMATDSWALAVDEQEAAAESVSWLEP